MKKNLTVTLLVAFMFLFMTGNVFSQTDYEVLFNCDMGVELFFGAFNPATDTLDVRGSFNGWSGPSDILSPDPFNDSLYSVLVNMSLTPPDTQYFKFVQTKGGDTYWETISNRVFTADGTEPDLNMNGRLEILLDTVYWDDTGFEDIFQNQTDVVIESDLRPAHAYLALYDTIRFGGATIGSVDSVYIAGGVDSTKVDPELIWIWDFAGDPRVEELRMNDDGLDGDLVASDTIWSITLTFFPGASRNLVWKHGIGPYDNEAGFAANHTEYIAEGMNRVYREFGSNGDYYDSVWVYNGIEEDVPFEIPEAYGVFENYPDPFNPSTTIKYALTRKATVKIEVFNVLGQKVRTLVDGVKGTGIHETVWNSRNDQGNFVNTGVYFYRFTANNFTETKKMILIK